jgi:hypothetical protein
MSLGVAADTGATLLGAAGGSGTMSFGGAGGTGTGANSSGVVDAEAASLGAEPLTTSLRSGAGTLARAEKVGSIKYRICLP